VPAFRVKLGANDLNCVDVPLNPTHSLTHSGMNTACYKYRHPVLIVSLEHYWEHLLTQINLESGEAVEAKKTLCLFVYNSTL